ncbi:MAG: hypothetical protein IJY92_00390 [Alphaproteobacteria bacterium]|nr:hypothetical protein [Alphaproteobacteria bacterium]
METKEKIEKSAKNWGRTVKISTAICGVSLGATIITAVNESEKDDFFVPIGALSTVASAGLVGVGLAKKDEKEVQLGKPSTLWPKIAKGSALIGLLSLGAAVIAGITEDKGDNILVPLGGLGAALSLVASGFSCAKSLERRNMKHIIHKTKRQTLKTALKLKHMMKKEKIMSKKVVSLKESLFSSAPLSWDTFSNKSIDENLSKTLADKVLTLAPEQVIKSSLPLVQNFARTHIRG